MHRRDHPVSLTAVASHPQEAADLPFPISHLSWYSKAQNCPQSYYHIPDLIHCRRSHVPAAVPLVHHGGVEDVPKYAHVQHLDAVGLLQDHGDEIR